MEMGTIFLGVIVIILVIGVVFLINRMLYLSSIIEQYQQREEETKETMGKFSNIMFELMKSEQVFIKYEPRFIDLFELWVKLFNDDYRTLKEKYESEEKIRLQELAKNQRNPIGVVKTY